MEWWSKAQGMEFQIANVGLPSLLASRDKTSHDAIGQYLADRGNRGRR